MGNTNKPVTPRNGVMLQAGVVARISGRPGQKEASLRDQEDHAREVVGDLYDGPAEYTIVATVNKGEILDRPELGVIEAMLRSGRLDLLVAEDLGRIVRGVEAVRLLGIAVDRGTRVIAPNDGVDTANETWEQDAIAACEGHVAHNAHTARRIKHKKSNRFKRGGVTDSRPIYGYAVPADAKTFADWAADAAATDVYREWFERLKKDPNCSAVADWLNETGVPPGPGARNKKWDGRMVRRVTANPILKGLPCRGRMRTVKHNGTGRWVSRKNPDGPIYWEAPHLAHVPAAEFDEVNALVEAANRGMGRKAVGGNDPRANVPKKRTLFPGQHAKCGVCNRIYYWGGHGLAGRVLARIENYTDGTPTADSNKTATFTYNAVGMTSLTAVLTSGGYQTTAWVYGVTTGTGSGLNSNDIVGVTQYPDPTMGDPSEDEEETVTVNALEQTLTTIDRNGTVHAFAYDVLGRPTADIVSSLGDGVDDAVLRVETSYDTQGNVYQVTTFDADTAGNVVNQIQRGYNGLSQLTVEYQATNGSVDTGTTPKVQYAYSEMAGGANHSRLTLMIYPSGRELQQQYAEGLDDSISRLTAIIDEETTLEGYQYLGLRDIVVRSHPEPDVDLSYVKLASEGDGDAGDQYTGLDRFGRVVDQRWRTPAGIDVQRFGYGHDRDGNRVYRENLVSSDHSEIYSYDGLNQLLGFERGVLNGTKTGITGTVTRSQEWEFDAVGNFADQTTDGVGQARTHNRLNEITGIDGATTPTYDANGNLTGDEVGRTFAYDAWNRLTKAWDAEETLLAMYGYDGTGRRVREVTVSDATDLYYSIAWQICEERVDDNPVISYAWSQLYIDAMIARNRDTEAIGELDERIYMVQDAAFNAVALLNATGVAKEFYQYDPFGSASIFGELWTHISTSNFYWKYFFQGLRFESDASCYNVRFRDMNPELARCFTKDPVGIVPDVNYYRWENNNPCNSLDPYGQQSYPPGWNPYAPYPGNGTGPAPKVPLKGPPPFPKAAGAKSGPFSNKETLLGANACWCPTDKKDRLTDITSVVINKGVPVGPSGGDHQFYGPLAPKGGRIGAGGGRPVHRRGNCVCRRRGSISFFGRQFASYHLGQLHMAKGLPGDSLRR